MLGQDLLLGATRLIALGWVQGVDAIDAAGSPVEPWDDTAVAWSLLGALVAALERRTPSGQPPPVSELAAACSALVDYVNHDILSTWNDARERTQGQVLAALHAAAENASDHRASWN